MACIKRRAAISISASASTRLYADFHFLVNCRKQHISRVLAPTRLLPRHPIAQQSKESSRTSAIRIRKTAARGRQPPPPSSSPRGKSIFPRGARVYMCVYIYTYRRLYIYTHVRVGETLPAPDAAAECGSIGTRAT